MPQNNAEDLELAYKWNDTLNKIAKLIGKKPENLDAVLFLIGIQELGQGIRQFSKEEKQDLMHIAVCRLLSKLGTYTFEGTDEQGWPHWQAVEQLPFMPLADQERVLKELAIEYFVDEQIF